MATFIAHIYSTTCGLNAIMILLVIYTIACFTLLNVANIAFFQQ